jgi:hypothetical protein
MCPIPGTSSLAHLDQNIALRLTDQQVTTLIAAANTEAFQPPTITGTSTRRRVRLPAPPQQTPDSTVFGKELS